MSLSPPRNRLHSSNKPSPGLQYKDAKVIHKDGGLRDKWLQKKYGHPYHISNTFTGETYTLVEDPHRAVDALFQGCEFLTFLKNARV